MMEALRASGECIRGINRFYEQGEGLTAIIDSNGHLETSAKNGSASNFLGMAIGDEIKVNSFP